MAESPLLTAPRRAPGERDRALIEFEPMPDDQGAAEHARPALAVGTEVDVRTGYDRSWASGFHVAEVTDAGYRLERASDRTTLPAVFSFDDVRRHRSSFWWV
jgi:hypothetical protein